MRKFRYHPPCGKYRWDLFLFIHTPPQFRSKVFLESIPEGCTICGTTTEFSEHKCDPNNPKGTVRVIEDQQHHNQCQKSSSCGNFHQNQCQFASSCVHENEMKTCTQLREEKHRKKWQKSEENLKSICKTYPTTNIDTSQRSSSQASGHHNQVLRHHHKSKKSKSNRLPPIQRFKSNSELQKISDTSKSKAHHKSTTSVVEDLDRKGETFDTRNQTRAGTSLSYSHPLDHLYSVDRDIRVDQSVREDNSMSCEPEWIVTKPEKVKPQDNLRLEGEMDLETTFRSTIDSSAQRMLASRGEQATGSRGQDGFGGRSDLKPPKTCTLSRKSVNRPKTSLKFGGRGYFTTLNKDTYKNFVIVDTSREKLVQERLEKIVQETSRDSDGKNISKMEKEEYRHYNGHTNGDGVDADDDDHLKQEFSSDSSYSQFEASKEIRSKTMDESKKLTAADYHMAKEHHHHHRSEEEDDDGEGQDLETDGEDRNVIIDKMISKMNDIKMTSSDMKSNRKENRIEEFEEYTVNREHISTKDEMKSMEMMKSEKLMEEEHHSIHRMMNGNHEQREQEEKEDVQGSKQSKLSKEMRKSKQDQESSTRTHDIKSLSSRKEQQQRKSDSKSSHANISSKVHDKKSEQINGTSPSSDSKTPSRATPIRPSPIRPVSSLTVSGKFKSDAQYSKAAEEAGKSQRRHYETLNEVESKTKSQSKQMDSNNVVAAGKRYYKSNADEMNRSNGTLAATTSKQSRSNLSKSTHNLNEQSSSMHKRTSDERISRLDQQQNEAERRRHRSVPRTRVARHKNESQLKFDGEMDFVTTTKQSYRNRQLSSIDHRNRPPKRDLFRTSSEAEFMVKPAFDESTTYNSQFRNKLYCPALDLNSRRSDFLYKGEAGGHHFYLPTNQL